MLNVWNPIQFIQLSVILFVCGLQTIEVSAKEASPPNILFVIADDWGAHASAYGTPWVKTPNFDRVAKEGILFTRAFTPNAKCAPSRACIITGRNSWQLKEAANHICYFPTEFKSWPEALTEHGWKVGHTNKGWGPGIAQDEHGKPRNLTGKSYNKMKLDPPTDEITNNDYAGNFADFLSQTPAGKPWAFWVGYVEPHRGYEYGSGVSKGGKKLSDVDRVPGYWPDTEIVRNDILDYAFEIEYIDSHLGRILKSLEDSKQIDNTLIVLTSDHGMPFPRGKGAAYEASNHVPLAMMWKQGITAPGRVVDDYISFVDLAPTIIEVAGLTWEQSGMATSPGKSLTDIFHSEKSGRVNPARDHVLVGMERHDVGRPHDWGYPIRGMIKDDVLLLQNFEPTRWPACNPETGYMNIDAGATKTLILEMRRSNGADKNWDYCFGKRPEFELYLLKLDPDCLNNLAQDPAQQKLLQEYKAIMYAQLKAEGDPRMEGKGEIFDNYPHASKAMKDYYDQYLKGKAPKAGWINQTDIEPQPLD